MKLNPKDWRLWVPIMIYIYITDRFFHSEFTPGNTRWPIFGDLVLEKEIYGFLAVKLWVCIALNVFVLSRWWIFFLRKPIKLRELKHRSIVVRNLFQLTLSKPNKWSIRNICDFTILFWPCDWDGALSTFFSKKTEAFPRQWWYLGHKQLEKNVFC